MDPKSLQQIEDYLTASGLRADELRKRMDEIKASTVEFNRELINAQRHATDLNRDFNDLSSQFKNIVDDLRKWDSTSTKINKSYKTLGGLADKLKYDSENISRLSKKDLESLDKKARIELSNLKARKAELDIKFQNKNLDQIRSQALINDDKELLKQLDQYNELNQTFDEKGNLINDENNAIKTLLALTQERLKEEEKINRTLGISGKLVDGIVGTLGKLGIESSFFENLKEDMRDAAKSGDRWAVVSTATRGIFKGIGEALKDPVTQLTILIKLANFFFKAALTANAQAVELGKSLGYGANRADAFRESMVAIERSSNNLNVTTANLTQAFGELVTATGFAYEFTADQLETQIKLTKQVGLTADEAANVQRFSILTGKTSEQTYKSFVKGLNATANQLKVGINFKATLAEALKVSGQLSANLGNDPIRIAKAIVQAKALGMTLEQTAKAGESLLNFESSIESELKAELLTGQQLNLERARAAALAGDQATLAEELAKNVGTAADFSKMNVLQQKALAEAVGMTSDELANTLTKREQAIASGKSLAQIADEERIAALERQNIQDKFNAAVEKLQSLFGNLMAGPLGSFIDALSAGLGLINKMIPALKVIGGLYLIIKGFQMAGNVFEAAKTAQLALQGNNLAIQNIMQEKSLVKKGMYHAIAIKEAITEGGITSVKAYALSLDEKSLVRRTIMAGITAKEYIQQKAMTVWAGMKAGYERISLALQSAASAIQKGNLLKSIGSAMMGVIQSLSSIPVVGWALGLAAAGSVAALGYKFLTGDDIMSENGYGKRTLLAPEGAIRLNDKDTVIAGTNLGGEQQSLQGSQAVQGQQSLQGSQQIQQPAQTIQGPSIDLTPMITAINEVKAAVDGLMNRPVIINMDSKQVGSNLVQGSYKLA